MNAQDRRTDRNFVLLISLGNLILIGGGVLLFVWLWPMMRVLLLAVGVCGVELCLP